MAEMQSDFGRTADDPGLISREARKIREGGDLHAATSLLLAGHKKFPLSALLCTDLGYNYKRKGDVEKSLEFFGKAHDLDPKDPRVTMKYGAALMEYSQTEPAEKAFLKLFEPETKDIRLLTALGNVYQVAGQYDFAAACFGRASRMPESDHYCRSRYNEVKRIFDVQYTPEGWNAFLDHVKEISRKKMHPQAGTHLTSEFKG